MDDNGCIGLLITNCRFVGASFSVINSASVSVKLQVSGVDRIVIDGETFHRDVVLDIAPDAVMSIIGDRTGTVRLGPCRTCGCLVAYDGDAPGIHDDPVACVMAT